jgi:hypothetical protein
LRPVKKLFIIIITGSLVYGTLRYPVFGGVDWIHFPLYVINKVFAISGYLMLIISSLISLNKRHLKGWHLELYEGKDLLGFGSLVLIIVHVFISVAILKPEYYDKFFGTDGKLNLTGELSMLFGVGGLAIMWMVHRFFSLSGDVDPKRKSRKQFQKLINLAILAGFFHAAIMGIKSWMSPWGWYGYLPPISLIASVGFLIWLFVFFSKKPPAT